MSTLKHVDKFNQLHIDIARNSTDDFNLFHDSQRWSHIVQNPFQGAIVLGFQLESFIEHKICRYRTDHNENKIISQNNLNYSNYQFSFTNAVKPGQAITVDIKETKITDGNNPSLSNRVSVKANGKLALFGYKKETQTPLFLSEPDLLGIDKHLKNSSDRSFLGRESGNYFLKRKFLNVSNAKNFLCGSLVDQRLFFDELKNKYKFPEIFPCAFISCSLLEKSLLERLDFEKSPLVYNSHKISIDRNVLSKLKSNDLLHILTRQQMEKDIKNSIQSYECYGLIAENAILFRAIVELTPLEAILETRKI